MLSKTQVEDLLHYIGVSKIRFWKGSKIQFNCPIHGESNPSCGIDIEYTPQDSRISTTVFHCFSCGASGNMSWFLFKSMPDEFKCVKQADDFLRDRYGVSINSTIKTKSLKRYEEVSETIVKERFTQPLSKIATYMSGKETYKYFYDRGFTHDIVKQFKIGRDLVNETVTMPIFWGDKTLFGVIGRYINPNRPHNSRFKIYECPKGDIVFPLDHFQPNERGEIILVEGMFDAMRMHQLGYTNTLTTFTNSVSDEQARLIIQQGSVIIDMLDNDNMGDTGRRAMRKVLGESMRVKSVEFPEEGKDPCDWTAEQISEMMKSASLLKCVRRI